MWCKRYCDFSTINKLFMNTISARILFTKVGTCCSLKPSSQCPTSYKIWKPDVLRNMSSTNMRKKSILIALHCSQIVVPCNQIFHPRTMCIQLLLSYGEKIYYHKYNCKHSILQAMWSNIRRQYNPIVLYNNGQYNLMCADIKQLDRSPFQLSQCWTSASFTQYVFQVNDYVHVNDRHIFRSIHFIVCCTHTKFPHISYHEVRIAYICKTFRKVAGI